MENEKLEEIKKELIVKEKKIREKIKRKMRSMKKKNIYIELIKSEEAQMHMLVENMVVNEESGEVHMSLETMMKIEQQSMLRGMILKVLLEKEGVKIKSEAVVLHPKTVKSETPGYIR
jgi:hypothetical protein